MTPDKKIARPPAGTLERATEDVTAHFRSRRPMRAGSLVVTVFGDAIAAHGGTVWLGSLIRALAPFGINQRLVRTSIYRLAQDGWFSSEQHGRRSYYSLTPTGRRRFLEAARHIYSPPRARWSGRWCLVLIANVPTPQRDEIRRELGWLGFAPFSANLLAHPAPDMAAVEEHLAQFEGHQDLVIFDAAVNEGREAHFGALLSRAWTLDELAQRYEAFAQRFAPVYRAATHKPAAPATAFRIRTLLVHEYRKIVLRDPLLPPALLPGDWPGIAAYELCRALYRLVAPASERYLVEQMETTDGPLPAADAAFYERFGGLQLGVGDERAQAMR